MDSCQPINTIVVRLGKKYAKVTKTYHPVGCKHCNGGYKGRIVICEILPFDRELDDLVGNGASRKQIIDYVTGQGFVTMVEDGLEKVVKGFTDLKELARTVDMTDRM